MIGMLGKTPTNKSSFPRQWNNVLSAVNMSPNAQESWKNMVAFVGFALENKRAMSPLEERTLISEVTKMFNQETLTAMFKGKEFGYGKWHLYFYSTNDFAIEEEEVDIEILDGVIKITVWETDDKTNERTEITNYDYIPFESIKQISFGKDF